MIICLAITIDAGLHEMEIGDSDRTLIQFSCVANKTANDDLFAKYLLTKIGQNRTDITDIFRRIATKVALERRRKQYPLSLNGLSDSENVYLNYVSDRTYLNNT